MRVCVSVSVSVSDVVIYFSNLEPFTGVKLDSQVVVLMFELVENQAANIFHQNVQNY